MPAVAEEKGVGYDEKRPTLLFTPTPMCRPRLADRRGSRVCKKALLSMCGVVAVLADKEIERLECRLIWPRNEIGLLPIRFSASAPGSHEAMSVGGVKDKQLGFSRRKNNNLITHIPEYIPFCCSGP